MRTKTFVACAFLLAACSTAEENTEELDPAGALGDEEWSDEGPTVAEEQSDIGESVQELVAAPRFQLPFPCGQVWAGQTRTNHSPQNSVDFNRSNDTGDTAPTPASHTHEDAPR